jgi:hypothetical protein
MEKSIRNVKNVNTGETVFDKFKSYRKLIARCSNSKLIAFGKDKEEATAFTTYLPVK